MSLATELAEALKDALTTMAAATPFSMEFTAERLSRVRFDMPDLQTLHVSVVPATRSRTEGTGAALKRQYAVDVAIQQKLSAVDNATVDALADLQEEIEDRIYGDGIHLEVTTTAGDQWICVGSPDITGAEKGWADEHLEKRCFTGVSRFLFEKVC